MIVIEQFTQLHYSYYIFKVLQATNNEGFRLRSMQYCPKWNDFLQKQHRVYLVQGPLDGSWQKEGKMWSFILLQAIKTQKPLPTK